MMIEFHSLFNSALETHAPADSGEKLPVPMKRGLVSKTHLGVSGQRQQFFHCEESNEYPRASNLYRIHYTNQIVLARKFEGINIIYIYIYI